jgi:hypothetical protein
MAINSCYGCVPPKRTPTCKFDGTCNKYAEAKAEHDKHKAELDRERYVKGAILNDRSKKVYNALKGLRVKKY